MNPNPMRDKEPKRYVGTGLLNQSPNAHKIPKKIKAIIPNFRISQFSVEFKFVSPFPVFFPFGLFILKKDTVFHN